MKASARLTVSFWTAAALVGAGAYAADIDSARRLEGGDLERACAELPTHHQLAAALDSARASERRL